MIRELLTPEAQADAYVWAAVLVAHASIGVAFGAIVGWWFIPIYIAFEVWQGKSFGRFLVWDSILDTCAVALGIVIAISLWDRNLTITITAILACLFICIVGAIARRN